MARAPYRTARRVFWVVDNGTIHRGAAAAARLRARWPNLTLVHLPVHASWLNQVESYSPFSSARPSRPPISRRRTPRPDAFWDSSAIIRRWRIRSHGVSPDAIWRACSRGVRVRHNSPRRPRENASPNFRSGVLAEAGGPVEADRRRRQEVRASTSDRRVGGGCRHTSPPSHSRQSNRRQSAQSPVDSPPAGARRSSRPVG